MPFYCKITSNHISPIIMSPKQSLRDILCLLRFFLLLLFYLLSFFRQKFIRHISRRLLNGNQWNFTGMLSTMSRCADYFWNFQNGRRCHGNAQNAKKLKNTKMITAGYSPNRNWWNLIGKHPHLVERDKAKKSESVGQILPQLPWKQKRGDLKKIGFLSSNFMNLCRNIHRSVWEVGKIQNSGRCHGNQGTKWPPYKKIPRFGRNLVSK